jgi:nicotinamidase-related amidase
MSDVLLVIDLQVGVLESCDETQKVLVNTATLLTKARAEGVPVVFVQHESPTLVRGTDDWQITESIAPADGEPRIFKRYRDSFANTTLRDTLVSLATSDERQRLIIVGAKSNNCVVTTAMSALAHGYDIQFVTDAHTTSSLALPSGTIPGSHIAEIVNQYFTLATPEAAYPNVRCTTATTASLVFRT